MKITLPVLTTILCISSFCFTAEGQNEVYDPYYNRYPGEFEVLIREVPVPTTVRDTVYIYLSSMDSITRHFGITFNEYVAQFMKFKQERDAAGTVSDDLVYMNYLLPLLDPGESFMRRRIVTREYTINRSSDSVCLDVARLRDAKILEERNHPVDVMLTCYGSDNTILFLTSPSQIKSCLGQLFTEIIESEGKIKGLNIYFPDYDFSKKRAMAQFVKSVSILIDSLPQKNIRNLDYYISFDERRGNKHESYLTCLAQMADSILLLNRTSDNTIPQISVIDYGTAVAQSLPTKLANQFYLAKYYTKPFPQYDYSEGAFMTNIENFIEADYNYNHWEDFLFILIGISVLIVVMILLYRFNPSFSSYLNKNIDYAYSLIIILIFEILLLIACLFEAMSEEEVFTIGAENRYFVLTLPLLFIFIVPMMRTLGKRRQLP